MRTTYECSMIQSLPFGCYKNEIISLKNYLQEFYSETGYFVDVDSEYTDARREHVIFHYAQNLKI